MATSLWNRGALWALAAAMMGGRVGVGRVEAQPGDGGVERFTLGNGATVVLQAVPGVSGVGVETFYEFGFFDEPAGLTQASHLIEHLVCYGATEGHAPGAVFAELSGLGMVNAETLADFTHYDFMIPAQVLERAVRAEAARLGSLTIDAALVKQEAPRCYAEAAAVDGAPQGPLFKFATMAAHQSWRHGRAEALIRGGLVETPLDAIRGLHRAAYTPANMTLVVVGGFDPVEARAMIEKHLGAVPGREPAARPPIAWDALPRRSVVHWDAARTGIMLAFAPPESARDRLALSLWGSTAFERLHRDARADAVSTFRLCTVHTNPVGDLPFMVYATLKPGVRVEEAEHELAEAFGAIVERMNDGPALAQVQQLAAGLAQPMPLTKAIVEQHAGHLAKAQNMAKDRAEGMVLGNTALQIGIRRRLFGADAAARAKELGAITPEEFRALLARTFDSARRVTTVLAPKEE